ncbi:uncharacterized protein [Ptychodera flava]|uniref:uncharacterized protein n=1 Tax=Ptychodera flava TaxID=63121 RepID=UPI00396A62E8
METYWATLYAALVTIVVHLLVTDAESEVVRLVGGDTPYEGQVEMFIGDEWLPVLYYRPYGEDVVQSWSFQAADILCKELGYKGAMSYGNFDALSGDPRRRITNIRCDENHESLLDCDFDFYEYFNYAATVKCNYDSYLGCYSGPGGYPPNHIYYRLTVQRCLENCRSQYYTYAGLHNARYCECGNETQYRALTKQSGDQCLVKCSGDAHHTCGGEETVGIYLASMGSCGGHVVGNGTIYSPGFPGYHTENQKCTWHVSAQRPRSILEFKFDLFNMDKETDSVTLHEMVNGSRRIIEVSNLSATSCSNTVNVTFKSGIDGGTRRGIFALKYKEVPLCPLLPSHVNGTLHYNGSCPYVIGDTVSISCKTGFNLSNPNHAVRCQQDATWNDTLPRCIAIDCGNPGEVENANRIGTQYSYNSTVIYTCHDGYYTNGNRTIRCTIEGRWTEKPSCFFNASMGSCGGHVVGTGTIYSPGFPGYYTENQKCTWHVSAQQPRSILVFKFVLFNMDEETDSVTLHEMVNGSRRIIEVSNLSATSCSNTVNVTFKSGINGGTRRGIFALKYKEVPLCPLLTSRVNGTLHYNGSCPYVIGDTASISCKTGFKLSSPNHAVRCQQDATWNGTLPRCIAIDCGNPGEVENAHRIGTQHSYNSIVNYTCHDGYQRNGSRTIRCTIEGRWTEKPSCFFNDTQLLESDTTNADGLAIGISLGAVTVILTGLALIIFLMRRKIQRKFNGVLGRSDTNQDEVRYCKETGRRNNLHQDDVVNYDNVKVICTDDLYQSVGDDQTEDKDCRDEETDVDEQVKQPSHYENLNKVDITSENYESLRNMCENESSGHNNFNTGEKVGESSLTSDSGSVENVAYESADIDDDDGDVYTEIDKDGDVSAADYVDFELVHHTERSDDVEEGAVDNIAYEIADSNDRDGPDYFVLEGP